jgi:ankyrin repeat protein
MAQRQTEKSKVKAAKKPNLAAKKQAADKRGTSAERQDELNGLLFSAAIDGNNTKVARLIKTGAFITTKDGLGQAPLHWAAGNGHTKTCALLIEGYAKAGGDIKGLIIAENRKGETALYYAIENKHKQTTQFLRSIIWLADLAGNAFMTSFSDCVGG